MRRCKKMKQSKKFKLHGDLLTFLLVAVAFGVIAYLLYGGHLTLQVSNMLIRSACPFPCSAAV